jgi:hypothetical protein
MKKAGRETGLLFFCATTAGYCSIVRPEKLASNGDGMNFFNAALRTFSPCFRAAALTISRT